MFRQIVLDTETTGLDPLQGHRLTELGCVELINRRPEKQFHTYLNPERELDKGAADMTGLTYEFLKDKPKFRDIVEEFIRFLQGDAAEWTEGTELIIHNAPFDLGFLNQELKLINHAVHPLEERIGVLDTLVLARQLHPGQKNNLDALCRRYNVDNSNREYHGALLDAGILAKVYLAMTAGQTSLLLGTESVLTGTQKTKLKTQKVIRRKDKPLVVIKATEAELKAHEAYLEEVSKA